MSQLSYIVLGAAIATGASVVGAAIAMHAFGKITLFFCAGAIYTAHHLTLVSELDGIGRSSILSAASLIPVIARAFSGPCRTRLGRRGGHGRPVFLRRHCWRSWRSPDPEDMT